MRLRDSCQHAPGGSTRRGATRPGSSYTCTLTAVASRKGSSQHLVRVETARVHARTTIDSWGKERMNLREETERSDGAPRFARVLRARASVRVPGVIEINRRPPRIARDGPSMGSSQSRKSAAVRHPKKKCGKRGNVGNSALSEDICDCRLRKRCTVHVGDKVALRIIDIELSHAYFLRGVYEVL